MKRPTRVCVGLVVSQVNISYHLKYHAGIQILINTTDPQSKEDERSGY